MQGNDRCRAASACVWAAPDHVDACRSITVHVKGDLTRTMKPGDHVVVTGAYLPMPIIRKGRHVPHTSLQNTVLHATEVLQLKESYAEHVITEEVSALLPLAKHFLRT